MGLSNAERQRRYRQQRKEKADSLDLKNARFDLDGKPQDYARQTLALMLALAQPPGEAWPVDKANIDEDYMSVRVRADMNTLPQDVKMALRFGTREWLSKPTRALWERDGEIEFEISILAWPDDRKRRAMARKLAREEEE